MDSILRTSLPPSVCVAGPSLPDVLAPGFALRARLPRLPWPQLSFVQDGPLQELLQCMRFKSACQGLRLMRSVQHSSVRVALSRDTLLKEPPELGESSQGLPERIRVWDMIVRLPHFRRHFRRRLIRHRFHDSTMPPGPLEPSCRNFALKRDLVAPRRTQTIRSA